MDIFDGSFGDESIVGGGIACGTDTPILVRLSGSNVTHALEYFRTKGLSEAEAKERVKERSVWYGIIDGEHSYHAITHLMETKKRWEGYRWFVTIVKEGFSIERYRQLARMQNERHNDRFFVEFTFFDMISNMKTEYDRLCKIQARVVAQDVVNQYCGYSVTTKKMSTLLQTANTVMRLPSSVIKVIGKISNEEHPEWVLSCPRLNKSKAGSLNDVLSKEDCRVFRNFIHITSLKSANFADLRDVTLNHS